MQKDEKDYEAENMTDLVRLINSKNNSRRIKDLFKNRKKRIEKDKS